MIFIYLNHVWIIFRGKNLYQKTDLVGIKNKLLKYVYTYEIVYDQEKLKNRTRVVNYKLIDETVRMMMKMS